MNKINTHSNESSHSLLENLHSISSNLSTFQSSLKTSSQNEYLDHKIRQPASTQHDNRGALARHMFHHQFPTTTSQAIPSHVEHTLTPNHMDLRSGELQHRFQLLLSRVERLEAKSQRIEARIDLTSSRVQKIEFEGKIGIVPRQRNKQYSIRDSQMKEKEEQDIQTLRSRWHQNVSREQFQKQMGGLDSSFRVLLGGLKTSLIMEMSESHNKLKKKFMEILTNHMKEKLQFFKQAWTKEVQATFERLSNPLKLSANQFLGSAVALHLREHLSILREGQQRELEGRQWVYFVDSQGFLLDSNKNYLLDGSNKEIKMDLHTIQKLRKQGLISPN